MSAHHLRLVAKGLLECCKASFTYEFQKAHQRALQFGENLKTGATHTFHLIIHQAPELEDDDEPLAIASLDVKNAFNTISSSNIAKALLACLQSLLIVGYADYCFLHGPLKYISTAIPVFKQTLQEAKLQLDTLGSEVDIPNRRNLDMAILQKGRT
jgi:hypothetical protein